MLLAHGYNTYMVGKWHLTPTEQETAAGPYDRWPLGRGFERFYGFLGGDTSQCYPDLVYDNHQVEPPATPEQGYHLTEDLVDHAIEFVADAKQVAPDKPFFMYFCTGRDARAAPRRRGVGGQVRRAVRRRLGRLPRAGLRPAAGAGHRARRTPSCPGTTPTCRTGTACPPTSSRLYARMMEVFAGFLEHTDHHIGRLLAFLARRGQLDNTLIMVVSDNGASAEGGPHGTVNENLFFNNVPETLEDSLKAIDELGGPQHFNHYPWGWAWAGNTPFRRWKRETYRGGAVRPVHRPLAAGHQGQGRGPRPVRARHRHGADRAGCCSASTPPAHDPGRHAVAAPGRSASPTRSATPRRATRHHTQYFEMIGHRAIYHDGWRAVCPWPGPSFAEAGVGFGECRSPRRSCASSTPTAGSCTTSTRTSPRTETSPTSTATS